MATPTMLDLRPATDALGRVVSGITDEQLGAPTPCSDASVARLLAHVDGLSRAFAAAAEKQAGDAPGGIEDETVADGWRTRLPAQLDELASAWDDPSAWTGQTRIGGTDQSGEMCGLIGLDEVIVHGWDLATATGQPFVVPDALAEAAAGFVAPTAKSNPSGVPGLFGPALPVPDGASPLERLLALTGRDPAWRPST